ncbi:unnamed protein product, partial [Symbiodinium sp. CCMP2456]
ILFWIVEPPMGKGKLSSKKEKKGAKKSQALDKKKIKVSKKSKKKSSSSHPDTSSSSEENPELLKAKEQMLSTALAFGLCLPQPCPKPKDLTINSRTHCHMRDLGAPQLATALVGLMPAMTCNSLLKLGGDVLQVRKSLTSQVKAAHAAAGKNDESSMQAKIEALRKESTAERLWQQRLLDLMQIGSWDALAVMSPLVPEQCRAFFLSKGWCLRFLAAEMRAVSEETRTERFEAGNQKMKSWFVENEQEMASVNEGRSPLKRLKSRRGDSSDSEKERDDDQSEHPEEAPSSRSSKVLRKPSRGGGEFERRFSNQALDDRDLTQGRFALKANRSGK